MPSAAADPATACMSAIPNAHEAIAPPTVFTEFVRPVATPVWVCGAAEAAAAGSAATRAPDPIPTITMFVMTCP